MSTPVDCGHKEVSRGTLQGAFSFSNSQVPSLLEREKRFIDAANCDFIGDSIEVSDGVMDELSFASRQIHHCK